MEKIKEYLSDAGIGQETVAVLAFIALFLFALLVYVLARMIIKYSFAVFRTRESSPDNLLYKNLEKIARRLSQTLPAVILIAGTGAVGALPEWFTKLVVNLSSAYVVIIVSFTVFQCLDLVEIMYARRPDARSKSIKGFVQLIKIVFGMIAAILTLGALIGRSPILLLSGIGALGAVAMLVFQDTILSIVASLQIGGDNMVKIGDWIEMPSQNADGEVIEISLHTVKVRNWDKTITAFPVRSLITGSFKNWQGMVEAGGRRINRQILLDQRSVRFLDDDEIPKFENFIVLNDYLHQKRSEISGWNKELEERGAKPVNLRRITNLGTFRAYVEEYLKRLPTINHEMTTMVRQMQPGPTGIPLNIYCFSNDTNWTVYEKTQSDIFDHLLAILPEFYLRVFQEGSDIVNVKIEK